MPKTVEIEVLGADENDVGRTGKGFGHASFEDAGNNEVNSRAQENAPVCQEWMELQ